MSFPLTIQVQIAPGADLTADPATWTWRDITDYARPRITITRGRGDEYTLVQPSRCEIRLDNAGGRFVARNAEAPWYPHLQRNTPLRVRVDIGSGYVDRFTGFIDELPIKWQGGTADSYVPVSASGVLRRLGQGVAQQKSALYRYLSEQQSFGRIAYWPCEDGPDATEAATADDQTGNLTPSAPVRFGSAAPLSGVSTMLDASGAYLHATMPRFLAYDWRVEAVVSYGDVPTATVRALTWTTVGTLVRWDVSCGTSGFVFAGYLATGVLSVNIATDFIPQPQRVHHIRCDITRVVNDLQARIYIDGTQRGSTTTVVTAATLPPTYIRPNPDAATDNLPLIGHLGIWSGNPASDSAAVALGMVGEAAGTRMQTVSTDSGVPFTSTTTSTETMGARPVGDYLTVMRDAEATDGGILYERTDGQLGYLRREDLYNQTVALALDHALDHLVSLEPTDDDQKLRNDVEAKRASGSTGRHVDEDSVTAEGRYEDSVTVNPETDNRLEQIASWRTHLGTVAEMRYPSVELNLTGKTTLHAGWLDCDIGSRITIDNAPDELPTDLIDLHIQGYAELIDTVEWRVTLNCSPASPWTIGVLEDAVLGRLDTAGSSLATANLSAKADGVSATTNVITVADSSAVGFSVGNVCVLHDSNGYRKESTTFTITAMASGFGFTNISFTPDAEEVPTGVFAGAGDTIRRVDETTLSVATTTGPIWTSNPADYPYDWNVSGEQVRVDAPGQVLNANPFLFTAGTGWSGRLASVAYSTAQRYNPAYGSLLVTPTGAGSAEVVATTRVAVTAGQSYLAMLRVYSPAGWASGIRAKVEWYTATSGGSFVSSSLTTVTALAVGAWTLLSGVVTAPPTAAGALVMGTQAGAPAVGDVWYATAICLIPVTSYSTSPQTFTVTRGVNGVRKGHAAGADVRLRYPLILGL